MQTNSIKKKFQHPNKQTIFDTMTTLTTELIEFTLLFINFMSQILISTHFGISDILWLTTGKIFEVSDTLSFVMFTYGKITDPRKLGVDLNLLKKVMDDKSGRQYVFAGHSMGCISALNYVRELVLNEGANPPYALICSGVYRTNATWNAFMENPRYPKERSIFYVTGIMESFLESYAGSIDPFALNTKVGSTFSVSKNTTSQSKYYREMQERTTQWYCYTTNSSRPKIVIYHNKKFHGRF